MPNNIKKAVIPFGPSNVREIGVFGVFGPWYLSSCQGLPISSFKLVNVQEENAFYLAGFFFVHFDLPHERCTKGVKAPGKSICFGNFCMIYFYCLITSFIF